MNHFHRVFFSASYAWAEPIMTVMEKSVYKNSAFKFLKYTSCYLIQCDLSDPIDILYLRWLPSTGYGLHNKEKPSLSPST